MGGMSSALVSGMLMLIATAASAQLKPEVHTGSLIPMKPQAVEAERAGRIRKSFARCLYARHRQLADRLLLNSDPIKIDYASFGIDEKKIPIEFGMESCLGHEALDGDLELSTRTESVRSMLQEEAYLAKVTAAPGAISADSPVPQRVYVATADMLPRAKAMGDFSDCVVRREPGLADAMLRTVPGSKSEAIAASALSSSLGACLVQGQVVKFTPAAIRAYVADGAWQLFVRPADNVMAANR